MDKAERNGSAFRRPLRSADRFRDSAIFFGSFWAKTPFSRSSALLCCVTSADQRRREVPVMADSAELSAPLAQRSGSCRLSRSSRAASGGFGSHRHLRGSRALRPLASCGGGAGLTRQGRTRHSAARFALEHTGHRARYARPAPWPTLVLAGLVGVLRAFSRALRGLSLFGRRKCHARAAGLGQTDGHRLLRRSGTVFATANLMDLLAYELAGLGGG